MVKSYCQDGEIFTDSRSVMVKKIHYTDNLFFINEIIKAFEAGLKLKLDPHLLFDNMVENTLFINDTLNSLYSSLKDNPYILGRVEYLRTLTKTETHYKNYLELLLEREHSFEEAIRPFRDKLKEMLNLHQENLQTLQNLLMNFKDETVQDIVSEEEFSFLLRDETEE